MKDLILWTLAMFLLILGPAIVELIFRSGLSPLFLN